MHGKFDNFDDRCDWFLDNFCNRLIVQNRFREIRVDDCAEAKKNDVTEQLRVISRWITDDRVLAQLLH